MPQPDKCTSYFLTYPRIPDSFDNDARHRFLEHLRHVGSSNSSELAYALLATEQHRDGAAPSLDGQPSLGAGRHWHCVAYFSSQLRLGPRAFDFEGRHPNIRAVGRKRSDWDRVVAYCRKEDTDPLEWGTPRHDRKCVWSDAISASTRSEAEEILLREKPRDWVINRRNIDYSLDQMFPVQETQETRLSRSASEFDLPASLEEWKLENFEYVI